MRFTQLGSRCHCNLKSKILCDHGYVPHVLLMISPLSDHARSRAAHELADAAPAYIHALTGGCLRTDIDDVGNTEPIDLAPLRGIQLARLIGSSEVEIEEKTVI